MTQLNTLVNSVLDAATWAAFATALPPPRQMPDLDAQPRIAGLTIEVR